VVRTLFIEHDHVSPPGAIGEAFERRGYDVEEFLVVPADRYTSPAVEVAFPAVGDYDAVVTMGAPWSTYDHDAVGSWVGREVELLRAAHQLDIPVLGICFGGQLLATAHGGSVARSPAPEFGWHVILSNQPAIVSSGPWFQWHYDRWTLPPGATEVARNAAASQAFLLGRSLAVQFHPELDVPMLNGWLDSGGRAPLEAAGLDIDTLVAHTRAEEPGSRKRAYQLVSALLDRHDA
jgi:GMP synthase-like glutamine amidotransferase